MEMKKTKSSQDDLEIEKQRTKVVGWHTWLDINSRMS